MFRSLSELPVLVADTGPQINVINCGKIYQIYRSHAAWEEIAETVEVRKNSPDSSSLTNLVKNWLTPDTYEVEFETSTPQELEEVARGRADELISSFYPSYTAGSFWQVKGELSTIVVETDKFRRKYQEKVDEAQAKNAGVQKDVLKAISDYYQATKLIRDASALAIVGIALVPASLLAGLSGLAQISLVGGGSILTGWSKYQDVFYDPRIMPEKAGDSNKPLPTKGEAVFAGTLQGAGTFVFSIVGGPSKIIKGPSDKCMLIIQAIHGTAVARVSGKDWYDSAAKGLYVFNGPMMDKMLKIKPLEEIMSRYTLPVGMMLQRADGKFLPSEAATAALGKAAVSTAAKVATKVGAKAADSTVVGAMGEGARKVGRVLIGDRPQNPLSAAAREQGRGMMFNVVDEAVYTVTKKSTH